MDLDIFCSLFREGVQKDEDDWILVMMSQQNRGNITRIRCIFVPVKAAFKRDIDATENKE